MNREKEKSFGYCDPEHLIRSAQRAEGNPDCFRTGKVDCDHLECLWRKYCIPFEKEPSKT